MNLLHIIGSVSPEGGGPVEGILRQYAASKDQIHWEVASCDTPESEYLTKFPLPVHALGIRRARSFSPRARFLTHYRHTPRFIPWLQENIYRFDAVIINGLWNYTTYASSYVLSKRNVPYFVFTHGMLDPWFRQAYPLKDRIAKQAFWWFNEGPLLSRANAVLFTCEEERRLASARYLGYQRYKEAVVGYGTTEPPPASREQITALHAHIPGLKARRFLLFLSRIHQKKGCDMLVEAFARIAHVYTDLDLVIAGPDEEGAIPALQKRAKELGIQSRIYWPGMISGEAKWGALREAEAFILPSHSENFGIVVAEAMACATPVLITDKVNIWREVKSGNSGLVETDTIDGTIRLMQRWLALSKETQSEMRTAARKGYENHFRMEIATQKLLQIVRMTKHGRERPAG
ncbi:glycosyltransferase [Thalassospira xiamenensis]|uniref:glycosyltransferase n=1 Tax=Thalassospira xiamenensis TaxID=220697 RepID=UPI000DEDB81E|nr:glycosyltransferase [Thalassospira xiamenensis]